MLELMARGGMRIGEVLKLTPSDIHERRLTLKDPKSGREQALGWQAAQMLNGGFRSAKD